MSKKEKDKWKLQKKFNPDFGHIDCPYFPITLLKTPNFLKKILKR